MIPGYSFGLGLTNDLIRPEYPDVLLPDIISKKPEPCWHVLVDLLHEDLYGFHLIPKMLIHNPPSNEKRPARLHSATVNQIKKPTQ